MRVFTSRLRWLAPALCLALAAGLTAACAGDEAATSAPTAQQTSAPVPADTTQPANGAATAASEPAQPSIEVGYKAGQRAPDFMLTTVGGENLTLDSFRGRPVILYFFATW